MHSDGGRKNGLSVVGDSLEGGLMVVVDDEQRQRNDGQRTLGDANKRS